MKFKERAVQRFKVGGSAVIAASFLVLLLGLASPAGAGVSQPLVTITVGDGMGVPGGPASTTVSMAGGQGEVGSVFLEVVFEDDALSIEEMLMSTEFPCETTADCPGGNTCVDGFCFADFVTACELSEALQSTHRLIASVPKDPEPPFDPPKVRLLVTDASRPEQMMCTTDEDCGEGAACPFGLCVPTCSSDEDCADGTHCRDVEGQMLCVPLTPIPDGDLLTCTFDILETALGELEVRMTPLTFGKLFEVTDLGVPEPMSLETEGVPGVITIVRCMEDAECPTGSGVCRPDGVCRVPTPSPTPSPTPTHTARPPCEGCFKQWFCERLCDPGDVQFGGCDVPRACHCLADFVGDCKVDDHADGRVAINELITGVNIALDSAPVDDCPSFDRDSNREVTIDELITAVNNALCG